MQNPRRRGLLALLLLLVLVLLPVTAVEELHDRWGPISTPVPRAAIEKFEAAVAGYASLRGEVVAPLEEAIALAPTYFLAHVYLGSILLLSTAVYNAHPLVQRSYAAAWELAGEHDLTARERGHLAAFQALNAGPTPDFDAAAEAWEAVLDAHPRDLLAIRSAHDAYIILGDTANLQASLARVLSRDWGVVGEGAAAAAAAVIETDRRYVQAMWAFALEENGDYARAAAVARQVLAEDPTDVTALHALAHTAEMASRKNEGEAIYKEFEGRWEGLEHSLFVNHVAWHRALFDLYLGSGDTGAEKALALYDAFLVRSNGHGGTAAGPATPLAMADAASLLWRLQLRGVDPGRERWAALRRYYGDGGYESAHATAFNDVHLLLCLAVADPPAARTALASMRRRAGVGGGLWLRRALRVWRRLVSTMMKGGQGGGRVLEPTNVRVLREVGMAVGEAIVAFAEGRYGRAAQLLHGSRGRWIQIGGSHAQRDVLMLTLIEACVREETDLRLARALLAERAAVKDPESEEGTWERLRAVEARMVEIEEQGGKGGGGRGTGKEREEGKEL